MIKKTKDYSNTNVLITINTTYFFNTASLKLTKPQLEDIKQELDKVFLVILKRIDKKLRNKEL